MGWGESTTTSRARGRLGPTEDRYHHWKLAGRACGPAGNQRHPHHHVHRGRCRETGVRVESSPARRQHHGNGGLRVRVRRKATGTPARGHGGGRLPCRPALESPGVQSGLSERHAHRGPLTARDASIGGGSNSGRLRAGFCFRPQGAGGGAHGRAGAISVYAPATGRRVRITESPPIDLRVEGSSQCRGPRRLRCEYPPSVSAGCLLRR
jgi:hypothetical protein